MANNRMWLVNTRTGKKIQIAKYYPSTGWFCGETLGERLNQWFDDQDFGHLSEFERRRNERSGLAEVPRTSAGGVWGAEYELELEETDSG